MKARLNGLLARDTTTALSRLPRTLLAGLLLLGSHYSVDAVAQTTPPSIFTQLSKPALPTRIGQSVTLLADGHWLLLGGRNDKGTITDQAAIVDTTTGQPVTQHARHHV